MKSNTEYCSLKGQFLLSLRWKFLINLGLKFCFEILPGHSAIWFNGPAKLGGCSRMSNLKPSGLKLSPLGTELP